ncbi:hypothetical protein FACS189451_12490 [Bacteroidia bacterium]|nr:hypothetical protein FACS189451_12490 [Bacteroidia bacterium]
MEKEIALEYSNGEVTVVWKPYTCMHAKYCWKELPEVFNPNARPWINMAGSSTERIVQQVKRCPSGALSYFYNDPQRETADKETAEVDIQALPGGPLMVTGNVSFTDENHNVANKSGKMSFCRCRQSKNFPYCDGSHAKVHTEN